MEDGSFKKLEQFFAQFHLLSYKKRETILRAHDTPHGVYYLKRGYVRVFSVSHTGEELTLIIFKPHDFFPILWGIADRQIAYYIEAMTSVELWRAPRESFTAFLTKNPDVLFVLTQRIIIRLGGLLTRMEYLVFGSASSKVASILLILAERFGRTDAGNTVIQVPLTHKDIANLVGITRETASIELKKFENEKIISHTKRLFVIHNFKNLKNASLL